MDDQCLFPNLERRIALSYSIEDQPKAGERAKGSGLQVKCALDIVCGGRVAAHHVVDCSLLVPAFGKIRVYCDNFVERRKYFFKAPDRMLNTPTAMVL